MPSLSRPVEYSIPDYTRGKGENLLLLLGLAAGSKVLLIGEAIASWGLIFQDCHFLQTVPPFIEADETYDLVLYHSGCAASRMDLIRQLQILKKQTGSGGSILIFGRNFFSFSNLKKVKTGQGWNLFGQLRSSPSGFRRTISRAGMKAVGEYLTFPGLESAEEFVIAGSRFLEVPHHWHTLFHLARRVGRFGNIADGAVYLVAPSKLEDGKLFQSVARQIKEFDGKGDKRLILERFDLRQRGAMVLFLTEEADGKGFIARVVSDSRAGEIVGRNQKFLMALQERPDLPASLKALLPRPLGDFILADSTVHVETLLEGILAWKVDRGCVRKRIFAEAVDFILRFQIGTKRKVQLGYPELAELLDADLARLEGCSEVNAGLCRSVSLVTNKIRQLLHGQEIFLAASHGDYGYGNILVDAETGRLKGVIDWDTGRTNDFPGLDFLNLKVQRARSEGGVRVSTAFESVISSTITRGNLDAKGDYQKHFGLSDEVLPAWLYLSIFRYLSRAAQYPELFAAEQIDYLEVLNFLTSRVPL
jgi:hypothetical protein